MKLLAGTSGYAFKEWKGGFYPADLKDDGMLGYYAGKFPTVEINNTFYRLPKEKVLLEWASQVSDPFTFAIKASQRITHHARLGPACVDAVEFLMRNVGALGTRLGPVLFQLPPNLKKDLDRLRVFLDLLPLRGRFTIEFRHPSWYEDEVLDVLRARDIALCITDQPEFASPVVATASWGYARLHKPAYDAAALLTWAATLTAQPWTDAYVFFKHDEAEGSGPPAVRSFAQACGAA
ncbi:MAG TPA: DUF72 domain-containing protein [Gemmatimonadaceae bacterium]|nr:DUF72 domain-containing protein [Gemmatimonadaceae bacterium]